MNIVLLLTQVSFLKNHKDFLKEEFFEEYVVDLLSFVNVDLPVKVFVLSDLVVSNNEVRWIGNIELKLINTACCESVIPEWLGIDFADSQKCWGDNYLLLHAKPYVKGPFMLLKDISQLKSDFLNLILPKVYELSETSRTYYFLSDFEYRSMVLKGGKETNQTINSLNSNKERVLCDFSLCRNEQCGGCLNLNIWILTPDFFELSELQFESYLIENKTSSIMKFSLENVLEDLSLKEIVELKPMVVKSETNQ